MLLGDLLSDPDLGLVLLTGRRHLDRRVRGLYITDLLDPSRYLDGGELVLTGMMWHNGPGDAERFVAALTGAGAVGLVAGTARLGSTPDDLVREGERLGLPVLQLPVEVSFNAVTERVLRATPPRRELVGRVAAGANLNEVLAAAAEELGTGCWVVSPAGWRAGGPDELDEQQVRELVRHFLDVPDPAGMPRTTRAGEEPFSLWAVESGTEPPAARWFVAVRGEHTARAERDTVVADLATAVALLRARTDQAREIAGRSVGVALDRALRATAGPQEIAARLENSGLPPEDPLRVAALSAGADPDRTVALAWEVAASTGIPSVVVGAERGARVLFSAPGEQLATLDELLRAAVTGTERGTPEPVRAGVSGTTAITGLRAAMQEAGYARGIAAKSPRPAVVSGAQLASHQVLLAAVPDELRSSYRERVLAELVDYDRAHRSELVPTLRAYLEHSGSWARCAEQLHVHVNTLRYRVRRIEEISGRDLSDFGTRVDFWLALELAGEAGASTSDERESDPGSGAGNPRSGHNPEQRARAQR